MFTDFIGVYVRFCSRPDALQYLLHRLRSVKSTPQDVLVLIELGEVGF
jgi:hypothetical protein